MRSQVFVPLLAVMALGGGAIALSIGAAPPTEPFGDIAINESTLRFENRGQRLTFQVNATSLRPLARDYLAFPTDGRLRWLHADLRPVEGAPTLSFQIFPGSQRLPAHLVLDSNRFPEVREFLRPQSVPIQADTLEIIVDIPDRHLETDESNRYRIQRPLPDLTLTHAQALPDEDTAWFVLRNRTQVPVVLPIAADLTWIGQGGTTLAGPFTWTVWPGPAAFGNQTPLVQLWADGRANTGVPGPPALFPRPAGAVALKFEVNPLAPADTGVTPVPERNRSNNTATVVVAPDLMVSRAILLPDLLNFTIRTARGPNATGSVQVLFQWETGGGQPTGQPVLWVFNRDGGIFPREFTYNTRTQRGLHRGIFDAIPADAAQLRITVNPAEGPLEFPRILEVTDQNNSVVRPRP